MTLNTTWRSVNQSVAASSGDVNEYLTVHPSTSVFGGTNFALQTSNVTYNGGQFLGWVPMSSTGITSITQTLYAGGSPLSNANGGVFRIPISYTSLPSPTSSSGTSFAMPSPITVSFGGSVTEVPDEFIASLTSTSFPEAQSVMFSAITPTVNANVAFPGLSTALSSFLNVYTLAFPATINVVSTSGFPSSGYITLTSFSAQNVPTSTQFQYSSITATSFNVTGFNYAPPLGNNTQVQYNVGTAVTLTNPPSFTYINAGGWVFATNTVAPYSGLNNATYAAQCGNGSLGQWVQGQDLPEYDCSCAYAPSTQTLFAYGPSGTLYSASFDVNTGTIGAWAAQQISINNVNYTFPFTGYAYAALPTLCVVTISAIDYLFMLGGTTNAQGASTTYVWGEIDPTTGGLNTVTEVDVGLVTQLGAKFFVSVPQSEPNTYAPVSGVRSFYSDGSLYVCADDKNVYATPVWIDVNQNLQIGSYFVNVGSPSSLSSTPGPTNFYVSCAGAFNNSMICTDGAYALSPLGCGGSTALTTLSSNVYAGRSSFYFRPFLFSAINENIDGSATLFSSLGFCVNVYPVTWLNVPVLPGSSATSITIAIDESASTHYGVNVGVVGPQYIIQAFTGSLVTYSTQGTYATSTSSGELVVNSSDTVNVSALTVGTDFAGNAAWNITTQSPCPFVIGQQVTLSGFVPTAYNGTYTISQVYGNVFFVDTALTPGTVTSFGTASVTTYPALVPVYYDSTQTQYPTAIFSDTADKYTYMWREYPTNLLTTIGAYTDDPSDVFDSYAMVAVNYDGIGGQNATSPMITSTMEIV